MAKKSKVDDLEDDKEESSLKIRDRHVFAGNANNVKMKLRLSSNDGWTQAQFN